MPLRFRIAFPESALAVAVSYQLSCLWLATRISNRTATPRTTLGHAL